jgi:hypothetical protein
MPDFRRGAEAISAAQKKSTGGGDFKPFTPEFFWKDKDEKYLLILNPIQYIPTAEVISFIPVEGKKADGEKFTRFERVIARTDAVIGEDSDPMVDEWDGKPRDTSIAVAVELEATYEEVKGRKRPNGFVVKTREFERRIRDEDGELTDEYEDVIAPEVAIIHASPHNFFNVVTSYDETEAPIEETPVKITRVGSDTNTVYRIDGYPDQEVDLTPLIDNIENVYYLNSELEDLIEAIDNAESDAEAASLIGAAMLDKRLDELVDEDRYNELYEGITSTLDKFGGKKKGKTRKSKTERPARRSQRRSSKDDDASTDEAPAEETPEPEAEAEEKPKRRTRAKKSESTEAAPADDRVAELRRRAEERRANATA